ncbi:hypothetical protein F5146DRAFT_997782 [Armillaria mellea]|nr:hypothetical protein F5146DRAFT_997782 [Armillaria mellea]
MYKISSEKQDLLIVVPVSKVQESFESYPECCRNRGPKAKIQEFLELITKASVQGKESADEKLEVCGCPDQASFLERVMACVVTTLQQEEKDARKSTLSASPSRKRIKLESPSPQPEHEEEEDKCSRCLQALVDRTTCSHEFCFDCLVVWTDQSRKFPQFAMECGGR